MILVSLGFRQFSSGAHDRAPGPLTPVERPLWNRAARQAVVLGASMAICGAAGLAFTTRVQAQARPFPSRQGGEYGMQSSESSEATADLQRRLAEMGYYSGEISGYHGPQTHEAVMRFQQDMGLEPDGIVGPATSRALFEGGAPAAVDDRDQTADQTAASTPRNMVQLNDDGEQVAALQRRLAELGYYEGDFSGVFDYATEAAVMQFQRNNGLSADGVVGPSTEETLRRPSEDIQGPVPPSEATGNQTAEPQASTSSFSEETASGNLLRAGDSGQAVGELQTQLQALGFYQGTISEVYGPDTEAAVIAFQQSQGLSPDGIVGPQVNSALYSSSLVADASVPETIETATVPVIVPDLNASPTGAVPTLPSPTAAVPTTPIDSASLPSPTGQQPAQFPTPVQPTASQQPASSLDAEQARTALHQNLDEGQYSIASLQRYLREEGLYTGEINGMLTTETQQAIVAAQRKHGLSQSDLFGVSSSTATPTF
jgi:peptidoglycan hydrolase-like protein with peptidoglycan-binding domain